MRVSAYPSSPSSPKKKREAKINKSFRSRSPAARSETSIHLKISGLIYYLLRLRSSAYWQIWERLTAAQMDLLDTATVGLKEPLAITWSGLFYWFHNHLCMLKDMSKCTSDISDHMKATRMGMITYHLSSLLYKTHLSETFRMFFQYLLAFTACALSSGSHKRINVHGWKCTRVKLFACCIWVYLAPFTIVWRWWRGVAWDSPLFLSI